MGGVKDLCASMDDCPFIYPSYGLDAKHNSLRASEVGRCSRSAEVWSRNISKLSDTNQATTLALVSKGEDDGRTLRMVWIDLDKDQIPWKLQMRQADLDLILDKFGIESAYRYGFTLPGGIAFLPVDRGEEKRRLICTVFVDSWFAMSWSHDFTTRQTCALCWGHRWVLATMQDMLVSQKSLSQHPLFPALLAAITLGRMVDRDLMREFQSVAEVENRTRYHTWQHFRVGVAEGSYASLSARMSGCAASLAAVERIAKILHEILDTVLIFRRPRQEIEEPDEESEQVDMALQDCIKLLQDRLKMKEVHMKYLSQRVAIQLTALFNLIAQKESRVGIAVAEDSRTLASASKEDSSAMKTLAAVTVVFLPGTFVAALFAMPLFRWNMDSSDAIISKQFWIYWAVTLPLTIVTIGAWVLWTKNSRLRYRSQDKTDMESLWNEIDGTDVEKFGKRV